jgi:hypothetical protein
MAEAFHPAGWQQYGAGHTRIQLATMDEMAREEGHCQTAAGI